MVGGHKNKRVWLACRKLLLARHCCSSFLQGSGAMLGPVKGCRPDGTIDDQTIYDQSDTPENPSPHNVIVVAEIEEK